MSCFLFKAGHGIPVTHCTLCRAFALPVGCMCSGNNSGRSCPRLRDPLRAQLLVIMMSSASVHANPAFPFDVAPLSGAQWALTSKWALSIAAFYCQSPYDGIDESQASLNSQNLMGLKAHLSNTDMQKPPKSCIQRAKSCLICLTLSSGRFGPAGVLNRGFATGRVTHCVCDGVHSCQAEQRINRANPSFLMM